MINSFASDRRRPVSQLLSSVDDTPMSHRHLKERSSIPSLLRHTDSFAITRVESSSGLADPITKVSSVPALLVSVSIKAVAIGDYQLWLDDKLVPTSYTPPFRSAVLDFDAQPKCLPGSAFDYVLFHVPRTGLDDIAADLAVGPVDTFRVSLEEEDLVLSQLTKSILPFIGRQHWLGPLTLDHLNLIIGAHLLQRYAGQRTLPTVSVGGLGPWQKRRATELLSENLAGRVRLSQLARAAPDRTLPRSLDTHARVADRYCGTDRFLGSSRVHSHLPSGRGRQSRSMEARSSALESPCRRHVGGRACRRVSNLLPLWRCSPTQSEATTDKTSRILQEALDLSS